MLHHRHQNWTPLNRLSLKTWKKSLNCLRYLSHNPRYYHFWFDDCKATSDNESTTKLVSWCHSTGRPQNLKQNHFRLDSHHICISGIRVYYGAWMLTPVDTPSLKTSIKSFEFLLYLCRNVRYNYFRFSSRRICTSGKRRHRKHQNFTPLGGILNRLSSKTWKESPNFL